MKRNGFRGMFRKCHPAIVTVLGCTLGAVAGRSEETSDSPEVAAVPDLVSMHPQEPFIGVSDEIAPQDTTPSGGNPGFHTVSQETPVMPPCGVGRGPLLSEDDPGAENAIALPDCHFYDAVIDVLVVYTPAARMAHPLRRPDLGPGFTTTDIKDYIRRYLVDTMNEALRNSGVTIRIRLVGTEEISYVEPTSPDPGKDVLNTVLNRLKDPTDGVMDDVHMLRDSFQADLVALVIRCNGCGGTMTCVVSDFDHSGAFVVLSHDWLEGVGLAHELGHNLGCGHNLEACCPAPCVCASYPCGGCPFYPYSWGYDFIGASGQWYSTVMSYGRSQRCGGMPSGSLCCDDGQCSGGQGCTRPSSQKILYYSNPDVFYDGRATGAAGANNALTINNNAFRVADFRRRPGNIWVDFAYSGTKSGCFEQPYNTLAEGVSNVPTDGTLIFKAGSTTATPTITKKMTMQAYGGTVRIGG